MTSGAHPHPARQGPLVPERTPPGLLRHPVPPAYGDYRWVYIWQLPLRLMHWIAALSIVLLVITGFYIGRPYFLPPIETTGSYTVQWVRLAHFAAAALLVATAIVRAYWLVAGNKFERFPALFPVRPRDLKNMVRVALAYAFIKPGGMPNYLGHNPMAQMSYTMAYLAGLVMIVTGFGLYAQAEPGGLTHTVFFWVPSLFGGLQNVRLVHHLVTWYFIIFPVMHIYLSIRSDVVEHSGAISSIMTGGKFVPAQEEFVDE